MIHLTKCCPPENGAVYIVPLGDFHIGAAEFTERAQEKLRGYIRWILDRPNAFTFLMGDIMNCATVLSPGRPVEEVLGSTDQFELAIKLLKPLAEKDRILGAILGNHEWQLVRTTGSRLNRTRELCAALSIPYCGADAFVTLDVSEDGIRNHRRLYDFYFVHGYGGGRRRGYKVNNLAELEHNADADVYICGHVHDVVAFRKEKVFREKQKLQLRKMLFVTSGSFLETLSPLNEPDEGYAAQKSMEPICIGAPRIRLEASHNRDRDIHVSI